MIRYMDKIRKNREIEGGNWGILQIRGNFVQRHRLQTLNEGIKEKKYEKFGPNMADKYALAVTKNLGLGCNSQPCSAGHIIIIN